MTKNKFLLPCLLVLIVMMSACGNLRQGKFAHFYHNMTARFNGYFNAKEKMLEVEQNMFKTQKDKFDHIIPVFTIGGADAAKTYGADLETIVQKCTKVIKEHDISKWIDDCYLLIAKAYFYKQDYFTALETFDYLNAAYPKTIPGQEARIWMVRCLLQQKKLNEAQAKLSSIKLDKKFPAELKTKLNLVEADYLIRSLQYADAIKSLESALPNVKGKNYKARYMFILAQLNQHIEKDPQAAYYYKEVIKKNPDYDLAFQSKLGLSEVSNDDAEVRKYMDRLIKDDKNISYFDQIYYTLAKIDLKEGKTEEAIRDLNLSIENSKDNKTQKARSFLLMADIYFKKPIYPLAKAYYDSASNFITNDFSDYENIKKRQEVLSDLVTNLIVIQREDSLLKLSKLPKPALEKKIEDLYNAEVELARQKKEDQSNNLSNNMGGFPNDNMNQPFGQNPQSNTGNNSANPFYNAMAVAQGYSEFINRWGNRPNEDNWRRKDKPVVVKQKEVEDKTEDHSIETEQNVDDSVLNAVMPNFKDIPVARQKYYLPIPFTSSQKNLSNGKIQEALYNVGVLYHEKLNETDKAILNFQEIIDRFPDSKFIVQANYHLYQIYKDKKQTEKANVYKDFILKNFPGSEYAMLIENPDQLREKYVNRDKNLELEKMYDEAYTAFNNNDCASLNSKLKEADERFSKNYLKAKFHYLQVICNGKEDSVKVFLDSLNSFIKKFPGDEVTKQAITLAEILKQKEAERAKKEANKSTSNILTPKPLDKPDTSINATVIEDKPLVKYNLDFSRPHHFALIFPLMTDADKVKMAFSNYNQSKYPGVNLEISNFILDNKNQILLVKNFPAKDQANNYFVSVNRDPIFLKSLELTDYKTFIIADNNFPLFVRNKDLKGYESFFKKNY